MVPQPHPSPWRVGPRSWSRSFPSPLSTGADPCPVPPPRCRAGCFKDVSCTMSSGAAPAARPCPTPAREAMSMPQTSGRQMGEEVQAGYLDRVVKRGVRVATGESTRVSRRRFADPGKARTRAHRAKWEYVAKKRSRNDARKAVSGTDTRAPPGSRQCRRCLHRSVRGLAVPAITRIPATDLGASCGGCSANHGVCGGGPGFEPWVTPPQRFSRPSP